MINQIQVHHRIVFINILYLALPLTAIGLDAYFISNNIGDYYLTPMYSILLVITSINQIIKMKESKKWDTIEAVIDSIELTWVHCPGLLITESFYPKITYTYKVNNQTITSSEYGLYLCGQLSSEEEAISKIKKLKKQSSIQVYMHPSRVNKSIIEPIASAKFLYLIYGQIFLGITLIVLYVNIKSLVL